MLRSLLAPMSALSLIAVSGCTQLGLRTASLNVSPPSDLPRIQAQSIADWEAQTPALKRDFATYIYGPWPQGWDVTFGETKIADANYLNGRGRLEETEVFLGRPDAEGERVAFYLAIAYPNEASEGSTVPIVISQALVDNCLVFLSADVTTQNDKDCDEAIEDGDLGWRLSNLLGRYIDNAPVDQYFDHGYAYASFYAASIVPDEAEGAMRVMASIREANPTLQSTGALMYWAYGFSAAIDYIESDNRIDDARIAALGHSRHGKSALLAAAWDERIALVLAHQSGFGGAALSRSQTGERLDRAVESFPHWFQPNIMPYAENPGALPIDQHQLLALIAPRSVFLGNGRRDVWSDPTSTYEAAVLADKIYELYGVDGLNQRGLCDFNPDGEIAYHMRRGVHGITPGDIDAYIAFLDAHF